MADGENTEEEVNLPAVVERKSDEKKGWLQALTPANVKRVAKGIGQIAGLGVKLSNAASQTIRDNKARDVISQAVATRISSQIGQHDPQMERAFQREADRLLGEQRNLDDVAEIATEQLAGKSAADFADGNLDDDWLYQFEKVAKGFSSERMKQTFARVLAGEILKPGSFSPATLQALTVLDTRSAQLLSTFVGLSLNGKSMVVPLLLTGGRTPGNNGLAEFGLNFDSLSRMQQSGLLNFDLNITLSAPERALTAGPMFVGGRPILLQPQEASDDARLIKLEGLLLSRVGGELSNVVELTPTVPADYMQVLSTYFAQHKLRLVDLLALTRAAKAPSSSTVPQSPSDPASP